MNLCITKLVQDGVRRILNTAGLEVLGERELAEYCLQLYAQVAYDFSVHVHSCTYTELVTASPLLYSTLKVLDEWESIFARRLDALGSAPEELFVNEDEETGAMFVGMGPAVMRHKFILEPENSPFQGHSVPAKQARHLWKYLVHRDECREAFIHHIFTSKMAGEESADLGPNCRSLYKAVDSVVTAFCIHPVSIASTRFNER